MTDARTPPSTANRLAHETSPYLLQHAHNPVDWYPWGPEALERAARDDRLILLSIGYSACHWCHVMERESFENEEIAALMNEYFVNIKVDREERPDLDEIYMSATLVMNQGQGGWPMTVFLTPEQEPVFAGTYFPPSDRYGRPGFKTILIEIGRTWRENREALRMRAKALADHLGSRTLMGPAAEIGRDVCANAVDQYAEAFDATYGGFGPAPKFPPATGLMLLLRLHRRFADQRTLLMVERTLEAMARGGMYDQIGGGFARYSTDRYWLVPHFEKMLYDNALLVRAYLEAYQVTSSAEHRRIATETMDYVLKEMAAPEGGFYSSTDADSEGVEGKFFVWMPGEIMELLGDPVGRWFNAYYDITPSGNWEGVSIPNCPRPMQVVAEEFDVSVEEFARELTKARQTVYDARSRRVRPALDDKMLTAWNGLMISALAEGFRITGEARYLDAAQRAADFVLRALSTAGGRLLRSYRAGKAHLTAYLEDYAYLGEGLIDLYEAGGHRQYLERAEGLFEIVLERFLDAESGAFYNTADDHEALLMRFREGTDGATPSPNATTASGLARLGWHLDRESWREAAARALRAYGSTIAQHPRAFAKSLIVADFLTDEPLELALVGVPGSDDLDELRRALATRFLPNRIQAQLDPREPEAAEGLPMLEGKTPVNGKATLYVCRGFVCQQPVTSVADLAAALG